jgi:hypothetical protein
VIARAVPAKHTSPSAASVSPAARAVPVESAGDGERPVWSHPIRVFLTTDGRIPDPMGGGHGTTGRRVRIAQSGRPQWHAAD